MSESPSAPIPSSESNPMSNSGTVELAISVLESSTEYSIIGKDLDGNIVLWNEGARRLYGYEHDEIVGKHNGEILHTSEDIANGTPRKLYDTALQDGKWEGT